MNPNVMLVLLLFDLAVYFLEPKVPDPFLFPPSSIADLVTDIQPAVVEIQVTRSLPTISFLSFSYWFLISPPLFTFLPLLSFLFLFSLFMTLPYP